MQLLQHLNSLIQFQVLQFQIVKSIILVLPGVILPLQHSLLFESKTLVSIARKQLRKERGHTSPNSFSAAESSSCVICPSDCKFFVNSKYPSLSFLTSINFPPII